MKHWLTAHLAALSMILCLSHTAYGGEFEDRERVQSAAGMLFLGRDYHELEKRAEHYRKTGERFDGGLWKLTYFDTGLSTTFKRGGQSPEHWKEVQDGIEAWQRVYPNSASAHIAYARMLHDRGWSYRGNSSANTVAAEAWKPYFRLIDASRAYLLEHKNAAAHDPRWYELMLLIGYQQQWPDEDFLAMVDEALTRHPTFNQIHYAAVTYFLPRWGGNVDAVEGFARHALERTQAEMGYEMYMRIYAFAAQTEFGPRVFADSNVNWEDMRRGIDDALTRYPSSWNYNFFARFACWAKDRPKTRALLASAGSNIEIGAWGNAKAYETCARWAGD